MDLNQYADMLRVTNGVLNLLIYLPRAINSVQRIITKRGFEIITSDDKFDHLKEYLNYKNSKDERKRCKVILKKHKLPKSVGIRCKSENDICFIPNKTIINKNLNNLKLKANDENVELNIGGGCFELNINTNELGIVHQKIMCGTVIKHKNEIYLLRHPLGGNSYYLARVDLFINGMIIELDDGSKVGLYY